MASAARILVVDDSPVDLELTLGAFRACRLAEFVRVAEGGREALAYLQGVGAYADRTAHPLPEMVLLDLNMPEIDGREVLRQVKSTPGLKRIPVVILSSSTAQRDLETTYDAGVNSYLEKPGTFDGYVEVVRLIERYWLGLNVSPIGGSS